MGSCRPPGSGRRSVGEQVLLSCWTSSTRPSRSLRSDTCAAPSAEKRRREASIRTPSIMVYEPNGMHALYLTLLDELILEVTLDLLRRKGIRKGPRRLLGLRVEVAELLIASVHGPARIVPLHVDDVHLMRSGSVNGHRDERPSITHRVGTSQALLLHVPRESEHDDMIRGGHRWRGPAGSCRGGFVLRGFPLSLLLE